VAHPVEGPVGTVLGSFGFRADASGSRWLCSLAIRPLRWRRLPCLFLLRAMVSAAGLLHHAVTGKTIVLTVNGVEVVSLSQNTAAASNIVRARFGVGYYASSHPEEYTWMT